MQQTWKRLKNWWLGLRDPDEQPSFIIGTIQYPRPLIAIVVDAVLAYIGRNFWIIAGVIVAIAAIYFGTE